MLDKDTTIDDAQTIYCPDCGSNYRLAWSHERDSMFVVCDCYEAENIDKFVKRFLGEHSDNVKAEPDDRLMYQ